MMNKSGRLIFMLGVCICAGMLFSISLFADGEQEIENGFLVFKVEPEDAKAVILQGEMEIVSFEGGKEKHALPPGKYILRLEAEDCEKLEQAFEIKAKEDTDLKTLKLPFSDKQILWTLKLFNIWPQHIILGNRLFMLSKSGLCCYDMNDGKKLWEKEIGAGWYGLVSDGKYIFLTKNNEVLCFDLEADKKLWEYKGKETDCKCGRMITASPEELFVQSHDEIICRNKVTGMMRWLKEDCDILSGYADGFVYASNTLHAYDGEEAVCPAPCKVIREYNVRTGKKTNEFFMPRPKFIEERFWSLGVLMWRHRIPFSRCSAPVIFDKRLYIESIGDRRRLHCFNIDTGLLDWTYSPDEDIYPEMTACDGRLYFLALDWSSDSPEDSLIPPPLSLHCLNAKTGKKLWRKEFKAARIFVSNPVTAGGNVYFISEDNLYCIDAKTGEQKWHKVLQNKYIEYRMPVFVDKIENLSVSQDKLLVKYTSKNGSIKLMCIRIDDTGASDWLGHYGNTANTNTPVKAAAKPDKKK